MTMDYGPDWPPRPQPARRRLDIPMLRPWGQSWRIAVVVTLLTMFVIATARGGYLRTETFYYPRTTYATTVVGPPPTAAHHHR